MKLLLLIAVALCVSVINAHLECLGQTTFRSRDVRFRPFCVLVLYKDDKGCAVRPERRWLRETYLSWVENVAEPYPRCESDEEDGSISCFCFKPNCNEGGPVFEEKFRYFFKREENHPLTECIDILADQGWPMTFPSNATTSPLASATSKVNETSPQ